jgi:hypothetical protein
LIGNLFSIKRIDKKEQKRYFLTGDGDTINQLKEVFFSGKKMISDNEKDADEIIFCEGKYFSFKEIIDAVQQKSSTINYKIHSSNSYSAVGSFSKNDPGEIIAL